MRQRLRNELPGLTAAKDVVTRRPHGHTYRNEHSSTVHRTVTIYACDVYDKFEVDAAAHGRLPSGYRILAYSYSYVSKD